VSRRALSFGAVAAAYERFRPGYPDELVRQVLAYAARPVHRALEIGAGTGKATPAFAKSGVVVTATDPDPAMVTELRRHVPDTVTTLRALFEDLPLTPAYGLVFAAASLPWTERDSRWPRVAAMLATKASSPPSVGSGNWPIPTSAPASRRCPPPTSPMTASPSLSGIARPCRRPICTGDPWRYNLASDV
jgi:SAM-dependent methyltransferase